MSVRGGLWRDVRSGEFKAQLVARKYNQGMLIPFTPLKANK